MSSQKILAARFERHKLRAVTISPVQQMYCRHLPVLAERWGGNSLKPRTIPSYHLHTQPSFCHVSCFRRRWAPLPAHKPLLCCDTLREMCHRVADRKWMVSQTHRQLTNTEDSSKCGGGVDAATAWWQPAACDAALLAEGPTPVLEGIAFPLLMVTNLGRRSRKLKCSFSD